MDRMQSKLVTIVLAVFAVAFIGTGLGFIIAPQDLVEPVTGEAPALPAAVTDMRAVSGGVALALGLFWAACLRRPDWAAPGLLLGALVGACMAGSRVVGFVVDGDVSTTLVLLAAVEALMVVAAVWAGRALGR